MVQNLCIEDESGRVKVKITKYGHGMLNDELGKNGQ